ncbi:MAG TPA: aromatic ring-hydroxylating dioxygenase subunit alpha, partial [Candidatus Binatia bacterium]|nr:aromatic ring-hydroxylating dioxygenase subunit alpha [Candidatus Binatia bacterium]
MSASLKDLVDAYAARPLTEASTPPASWYTDSGIWDLERRAVFSRSWQFCARADQIGESGRYVSGNVAGEPVLIVRGRDNTLRAFFNVCRHHAAAILTQAQGTVENLRCPYHGWTYDLEGSLVLAPDFGGVTNFDRAAYGLAPMELGVWKNWLFVRLEAGAPSLADFLGEDLIERFERLNPEQLRWFERRSYFLNCNWKVFVDNYLDGGYHVPHIHGGLNSVL